MSIRFALAIAGATLIAAPQIAAATPRDEKANVVRQLAVRVGSVLGAASACRSIAQPRIKGVTDKITEVIKGSTANKDELSSILQAFELSVAGGQRAISGGQTDCATAERELGELERAAAAPLPLASPGAAPAPAPQPGPMAAVAGPLVPMAGGAIRGVTDKDIRFGMVAPFSGPARELGRQMKLGVDTAFNLINDAGGVHGRQLKLITADDGYEPSRTAEDMKQLYDKDQVFGIVGNVGTPTSAVAVPYALEHRMLFFGAFTGAPLLRRDPPDRYVFNYRASYAEETEAIVHYLVKVKRIKPEHIAVFAQEDAYGDAGVAGVEKAMRALRKGDSAVLRLNYKRNTVNVDDAVAALRKPGVTVKAVVMVATYRAAAKFIEKTHDLFPSMIYTNVSFVGSTALADELMLLGPKYAAGVIVTQTVPAVEGYSSVVLDYKSALAKYFPGEAPDYVSLEGYVAASILVEALKRAGPQLDTERLVETLEGMRDFDMGLGTSISFGRSEHQGSHKVWGTQIDSAGHYQAIDLQ